MNSQSNGQWVRYEDHHGHLIKRVFEPMDLIKNRLEKEPENISQSDFLELAKKDSKGLPQSTGPHIVKLLRGEDGIKKDFHGKEVEGLWLFFQEKELEKKYFIPTYYTDKNKDNYGKFHYLYERFGDIEEGSDLELEYIRKGASGYISVNLISPPIVDINDIPIIEDNTDIGSPY